tara:strand:+ start:15770 stop:16762 length:993 start_codon:yes stop_codon:yes gene_type:complete
MAMTTFYCFLILAFSITAQAGLLELKHSPKVVQQELNIISSALRPAQVAKLPTQIPVSIVDSLELPDLPTCGKALYKHYVSKSLGINKRLISLMSTPEYKKQYGGCSHKIAFFLAMEQQLQFYHLKTERDIPKRVLTLEQEGIVSNIVKRIIKRTHHQLRADKINIEFFPISSDDYFMISNFKASRLIGKDHYRVGINPKIFALDIPMLALEAVLAHELEHTTDYVEKKFVTGIIPIGIRLLFKKHRYLYERRTDLKTLLKGYGLGMIRYKRWQYNLLSPNELRIKRENYLSPEEIDIITKHIGDKRELIELTLKAPMPKNLVEWQKYLN